MSKVFCSVGERTLLSPPRKLCFHPRVSRLVLPEPISIKFDRGMGPAENPLTRGVDAHFMIDPGAPPPTFFST